MNCTKIAFVSIMFLTACSSATPSVPTSTAAAIPLATQTTAPSATAAMTLVPTATLVPTLTQTPTTAMAVPTFAVSGIIFFDYNGNGARDDKEPIIPNAKVQVGNLTATSDKDGNYSLPNVPKGKQELAISADGFHFVALSREAFQSLDRPVLFAIDGNTKRDWGLMVGFLTLPYKSEDAGKMRTREFPDPTIIYVDVDVRVGYIHTYSKSCPPDPVNSCSTRDNHQGIDWPGQEGTPLVAMAPGTVIDAWEGVSGATGGLGGLQGKRVAVMLEALGRKFVTEYTHNQENLVQAGQKVERGQVIALLGKTGSDMAHLHVNFYEVNSSINTWNQVLQWKLTVPHLFDSFHQHDTPQVLDPFRDLSNPASVSFWTRDNLPEYAQSKNESPDQLKTPSPAGSKPNASGNTGTEPNVIVDLADSAIIPDGNANDWGNRRANLTPPPDVAARAVGADISALYVFADSKNLYLRLDQHGGFPHPPLRPVEYSFELTSTEWGGLSYQIIVPNSGSTLRILPIEGTTQQIEQQKIHTAVAIGQVLEAIVPLEMLEKSSQVEMATYAKTGGSPIKWTKPARVSLRP